MRRITFIGHDGVSQTVTAEDGQTLMQAATGNSVRGIVAECGGARVCASCHCYIGEAWMDAAGAASEDERLLLEFSENYRANSRLSCQIHVCEALDGMVVHLPASQP